MVQKIEAAIKLFREGKMTLGRAAEISGLTRWEFDMLLADRGITRIIEAEDILQQATAKCSRWTKALQLTAVIQRKDDGYVATCPELDVVSQGDTLEQARMNLLEAVEGFFEVASPSEIKRRQAC